MAPVRLRSLSRRSRRGPGPAGPLGAHTLVGNLDSRVRVPVDPAGRVAIPGQGWVLDWWIGAEDRWHRPVREAAVRQELLGASPVVQTRVRIPSGDATARAYAARGPKGEDLLVLEVQNDSKVPVALALVVEPADGPGSLRDVTLRGSELRVDGTSVWLPRSPGRFALSTAADARPAAEVVLAGDAEPVQAASVSCADGDAQGVLLFPLAHTATFRIAIPLDASARALEPGELPSARQVASGWATHSSRAARLEVPDRRLRDAISASTRFLLLADDHSSLETIAARWEILGERPEVDPLRLAAMVEAWARHVPPEPSGHRALPAIAALLDAMGEPRAAEDVRAIHGSHASASELDLDERLATASPTWTWATERRGHDLACNGALLLVVRDLLVAELEGALALSPVVPDGWLGLGWEVHGLPTACGRLSFAIRWHGDRPALLWELDRDARLGPVRLTTPRLDPSWSTTDPRGEALLAPVAVPERPSQRRGLTIPVAIEPMRRRP
jgi:hypothetical protein